RQYSSLGALAFLPRSGGDEDDLLPYYLNKYGLIEDRSQLVVGNSLPMLLALRDVRRTALSNQEENILLRGESGVGKGLFARLIHLLHPKRCSYPLETVNAATLTDELFAAELFGVKQGYATDVKYQKGAVARAEGGDLFLDEIQNLVPQARAGILNFLQEHRYHPKGSDNSEKADVRVISATNADLDSWVKTNQFPEALLTRLRSGGMVTIPSLADCHTDLRNISSYLLRRCQLKEVESKVYKVLHTLRTTNLQQYKEALCNLPIYPIQASTSGSYTLLPETLAELMVCQLKPHEIQENLESIFETFQGFQAKNWKALESSIKHSDNVTHLEMTDEAIDKLKSITFAGNMRDLRAMLEKVLNNNDVEYITPSQIEKAKQDLGITSADHMVTPEPMEHDLSLFSVSHALPSVKRQPTTVTNDSSTPSTILELIEILDNFEFDQIDSDGLRDKYDALDEAATRLILRYVAAGLKLSRNHSTREIKVLSAVKLIAGETRKNPPRRSPTGMNQAKTWNTTMAYDLIKRLFGRNPTVEKWAMTDPQLKAAYEKSQEKR
ncbi:MAG: sigma-54 factor interaction domain-containing protein, partial [Pirellulaceae bacterium]|nr:sigma-54 factor interaction domain-containing protein [Pirellulaceae bacterium]